MAFSSFGVECMCLNFGICVIYGQLWILRNLIEDIKVYYVYELWKISVVSLSWVEDVTPCLFRVLYFMLGFFIFFSYARIFYFFSYILQSY